MRGLKSPFSRLNPQCLAQNRRHIPKIHHPLREIFRKGHTVGSVSPNIRKGHEMFFESTVHHWKPIGTSRNRASTNTFPFLGCKLAVSKAHLPALTQSVIGRTGDTSRKFTILYGKYSGKGTRRGL
ncbi:hypothetical protein CDAR_473021 [Caerostris darwini]|uniref:Uncharacterized protein n=1 Tax=Caerostris darwini TaxID=1538125 RepID=A0AAV4VA33_9ARAC|nr:hypothetical protein CDAR_473021 [Caerostris darwini]